MRHRVGAALTVGVVALLATGCMPEPAPTPSPTGFASEEEAFAAAEETYRAYVDAVNARREDPTSEPAPTDFLTGSAYNDEIDTQQALEERGWRIQGETHVVSIEGVGASVDTTKVAACIDASGTRVLDVSGADVTPLDRHVRLSVLVAVSPISGRLLIKSAIASDSEC